MTESQKHRELLLNLAADPDDKSALLAYVNLLGIVALGHTLEIKPSGRGLSDHFEGSLTSRSGARKVNGDAPTVALLARELVHRWMGGSSPLIQQGEQRLQRLQRSAPVLKLATQLEQDAKPRHSPGGERCECGALLGRVSGMGDQLFCIVCDAEVLAEIQGGAE